MPVAAPRGLLERPTSRSGELIVEVRDGPHTLAHRAITAHAIIGRSPDAQIRLDRGTISRQHAEVLCDPFGRWWIRDMGSRNGVVFAGQRVTERAIRHGDVFEIGDFALRFQLSEIVDEDNSRAPLFGKATSIPVSDLDGNAGISTAGELGSPKVAASHLSLLLESGRELMESEDFAARLTVLLRLMLHPEFKATCAMALRVYPGHLESPQALVPMQTLTGHAGGRMPVSRALLHTVLERRAPAMIGHTADGSMHGDVLEVSVMSPIRRMCAVACPLKRQSDNDSDAMDLLYIIFPPECASGEWLAIVALATEQYRLAESAWEARQDALSHAAIERDLEQARQIQIQFLPTGLAVPRLEVAVGFQPCRWVAGDFTDAMILPDGRVFIGVADVCGKGLAAALVASSLHTLVRAMLDDGDSLERMMNRLNRHFVSYLRDGRFATMACAIIDPATGLVEYANCGHPPIFIVDNDGVARDLETGQNLPLGVDQEPIALSVARLEPGEMLAMYTDGLSEARTVDGEMVGIARVRIELCSIYDACRRYPVSEACHRVMRWIDSISGGRIQDDDRTYLLARRT